ncbi:unnamed protein product [Phytophthora lilii]|uniref:Unnamed protein product n=1 Tax=Phytophthora lilii TaxID=2077276 RepID=A0A9W6TN48_9STRA|nr:unnamed protein product [Phytophthora lilii]
MYTLNGVPFEADADWTYEQWFKVIDPLVQANKPKVDTAAETQMAWKDVHLSGVPRAYPDRDVMHLVHTGDWTTTAQVCEGIAGGARACEYHLVAQLTSNDEQSIPSVVVFTVDVVNGLYSSICMQASSSWLTSSLMIALNAVYTVLSTLEINRTTRLFCELCQNGNNIPSKQVWNAVAPISKNWSHSAIIFQSAKWQVQSAPADSDIRLAKGVTSKTSSKVDVAIAKKKMSSILLFRLEYRVLVGYIEAVIPLLYAVYLSILVQMPNARYYPHTRSLTSEQLQTTVSSILVYASTEMLSFVWLYTIVKRKLGFSLFYQLAFVLETEMEQLQARLFIWIMLLSQLPLVHFDTSS